MRQKEDVVARRATFIQARKTLDENFAAGEKARVIAHRAAQAADKEEFEADIKRSNIVLVQMYAPMVWRWKVCVKEKQ